MKNQKWSFFVGALAAITRLNPDMFMTPRWVMPMMSGRRVIGVERFNSES